MKNKFKGFTLVECIVALAILGIASLTMAQIYGSVAKVNKDNHEINTSISNQMKYVEKRIDDGGVVNLQYGGSDAIDPQLDDAHGGTHKPPHQHVTNNNGTTAYIHIKEITGRDASGNITTYGNQFSYPIDVSVLKIRDEDDKYAGETGFNNNYNDVGAASTNTGSGPKYKYFTAH